ncbi:MAG: 2-succinyl-5-enolpyruvyl-6-hydroxy-3-cyclohexene-1-carboxylic-acid synthase [Streptosporangiales bacterium]|nr:2-succinyl-5-enolpyruvyl-6-hydroxy-3-cyclohexene-1-carboxylic-acid synthase [Streptosporangiales bacterium]
MNPSTALAEVLVDELIRCGLRDAVLAPGSRSAPLAMALHAAATAGRLRLHVRIDERSAGYLALGLAETTRRPAAVVCTSGTAAANLYPAVVEADESGVPLLVLTADRPPELRGTGASQTIDQIKMYGSAVRWFCETGVPEPVPGQVAYWRSLADRAYAIAALDDPGPVHLNLAFRDPLVPDGDPAWPEPLTGRPGGGPWTAVPRALAEPVSHPLPDVERGVIICGDGDLDPAPYLALAEATGWPILAEPTSNLRRGPHALGGYRQLLAVPEFAEAFRPDLVVTAGRPGLSRQLLAYVRRARRHVVVGPRRRWPDPTRTAAEVVPAVAAPAGAAGAGEWAARWARADAAARSAADAVLDAGDVPSEPRTARDLAAALDAGSLLVAGSSMPIRDLDGHMAPRCGLRLLANRGASGIDGVVSTAVGAAIAHQAEGGGAAYALIGDLSLLHDQNGLILGPGEIRPDLAFVVVNNDGGGIFNTLEQAAHPGPFERVFGTPHGLALERVAAATGTPYVRLERASDLADALKEDGIRIIEVRTGRVEEVALRRRIIAAVSKAVTPLLA